MKLSWKELMARRRGAPPPPVHWRRDDSGAIPVTRREERRVRRGTAAMAMNRRSEKMNRLLRSAFVSILELMVVVVVATLFGRFLYTQYQGASVGRAVIQAVLAVAAFVVWLNLIHNRYRTETREAISRERIVQLERDRPRGAGADPTQQRDRAAGVDRVDPPRQAEDVTTTLFDQHDDDDDRNQPWR